jgi:hypothetical protein
MSLEQGRSGCGPDQLDAELRAVGQTGTFSARSTPLSGLPANLRGARAKGKRWGPGGPSGDRGGDGRLGPELRGREISPSGDCSVNAGLWEEVSLERLPGHGMPAAWELQSATTGDTPRPGRTFPAPGSSSPCAVAVTTAAEASGFEAAAPSEWL